MNRTDRATGACQLLVALAFGLSAAALTPIRSAAACGDGTVEFEAGETCDDGNTFEGPGDGCPADCSLLNCSSVSDTLEVDVTFTAAGRCVGDCDGDGNVAVNELISGVNIALGSAPVESCASFDTDGGGEVTVHELVSAVNAALNGCPETDVGGMTVFLRYPDGKVRIPGSGNSAQVQNRILNLPENGFSTPNDQDYGLTMVIFSPDSSPLAQGRLFTVQFDRCEGAGAVAPSDFTCLVPNAADTEARPVSGVTCAAGAVR